MHPTDSDLACGTICSRNLDTQECRYETDSCIRNGITLSHFCCRTTLQCQMSRKTATNNWTIEKCQELAEDNTGPTRLFWKKVEEQSGLLPIAKCRKFPYFGHVVRAHNLCTSILHGHIDGTRPRGRPSIEAGWTTSGCGLVWQEWSVSGLQKSQWCGEL